MNKYKRLGKNTFLIFIGNFGSKIITFLLLPFYTSWLSVESYGIVDIIWIYSLFLFQIFSLCISDAVFVFPNNQSKDEQSKYFSTGLGYTLLAFIIGALIFQTSLFVLNRLDIENSFTDYAWSIYFIMFFVFTHTYNQQFSRSIGKVKEYAISGILVTSFIGIFSFLLMPAYSVMGFVFSNIFAYLSSTIYLLCCAKTFKFFSLKKINYPTIKQMYIYSIPLVPNAVMWWLISSVNRPILEYYMDLKSIGVFAVANKLPNLIFIVFSVFSLSWQIAAFEEYKDKNYSIFYNQVLRGLVLILVTISCMMAIFSKELVYLVADSTYEEGWKLIPIIALAIVFASIAGFVGINFSVSRKSKYYFYTSVFGGVTSVLLNLLLIPYIGLFGAAVAIVFSHFVMAVSRIGYSWKIVKTNSLITYAQLVLMNLIVIFFMVYFESKLYSLISFTLCLSLFFVMNKLYFKDFLYLKSYVLKRVSKKNTEK